MNRSLALAVAVAACGGAFAFAQPAPPTSGIDRAGLDPLIRPQDDLFRYVNSGWLTRTAIPPDRVSHAAASELADKAETDLRGVIEDLAARGERRPGSEPQQILDLYASMMDEARLDALGVTPVRADLDQIDAIKTTTDLARVAGYLSSIAAGGPFDAVVSFDAPSVPIVRLVQGGTMLPDRSYYLSTDPQMARIRAQYETYLTAMFTAAGRAEPGGDARAVVAIETALARMQWPEVESRDPAKTGQVFPFNRLGDEFPGFDWRAWARPQGIDRAPNINVAHPSFFRAFAAFVPSRPIDEWRAWLASRYLTVMSPYLPRALVDARFEFFGRILTGQEAPRAFWKRGVSLVSEFLGDAIGRRYVAKHFPAKSRARVLTMVDRVVAAYRQAVRESSWMSAPAKSESLRRLTQLRTKIGYPDRWRDYIGLEIRPDDLIGNIRRVKAFENRYRMARLQQPADPGQWLMTAQTVNAYYSPGQHEIVFPAGILQPPYFTAEADDAVNYGAIGAVIGHEIGHALSQQEFLSRAGPLVEQFDGFSPLEGLRVNGTLTLSENLGDLGGLSIAYRAYRLALDGRAAPVIEGLTGEQRFFIGWAQIWRSKTREAYVRYQLGTSPYAPSEFRANGPVSHLAAFHEAFGVKPPDTLYREPSARLRIW